VLASMVFPPTQHCGDGGQCGRYFRKFVHRGQVYRRPQQYCKIYNYGTWLEHDTKAGYCISPPVEAYTNGTMRVRGSKEVYAAAFKWSMEQSGASFECSDEDFCRGRGVASGELGRCECACKDGFGGARCEDGP